MFGPRLLLATAARLRGALLGIGLLVTALGAAPLVEKEAYFQALQALDSGLPGVAALKAEELLAEKGARWSEEEAQTLATLAAEGWTRDFQPEKVLALMENGRRPFGGVFWQGQALLMLDRLEEAERVLREHDKAGRYSERARLCLAQVFLAQGREALARRELKDLRESQDPMLARQARLMFNESELGMGREQTVIERLKRETEKKDGLADYLIAQALFQMERFDEAGELLSALIKAAPGGERGLRLHQSATLLQARVLLAQGRSPVAQEALIQLIAESVPGEFLFEAFVLLEAVREKLPAEQQARLPDAVVEWLTQEARSDRRGYALHLAACWLAGQGRTLEAAALLESFLAAYPSHPRRSDVMRKAMELEGSLGHDQRVLGLAETWKNQFGGGGVSLVDQITGSLLLARGDQAEALARFQRAADLAATLPERRRALFNAGVAALKAGEMALYASLLGQLQSVSAVEAQGEAAFTAGQKSGETAADLELDRWLGLAAKGDGAAAEGLQVFLVDHAGHPRCVEAQVALAELALLDSPPRVKAAELALAEAEKFKELSEPVWQRLAYTRMWCREAEADWKGVVEAGLKWLQDWPQADLAAAVRMKVADAYFRQEDFANAQTQFELVAKNHARSDYAETALYLAGRCAVNLTNFDAAIGLWESVAIQGGRLSRQARIQQAQAKRREGKEPEALKVVDELLAEKDLDPTVRRLLTCDKAEMLILLGAKDARHLKSAVTLLRGFLAEPELPAVWQVRAGYWLAFALETAGEGTAALAACQDAMTLADKVTDSMDPEVAVWYYRAGFLAVDLLQKQNQWEGAARMAERLAAAGGERATEAKNIATRIRLERFLWDEKP